MILHTGGFAPGAILTRSRFALSAKDKIIIYHYGEFVEETSEEATTPDTDEPVDGEHSEGGSDTSSDSTIQ